MCPTVLPIGGNLADLREELAGHFVHLTVLPTGPESWKTKCGIREGEDVVPITDDGTLIMRRILLDSPSARRSAGDTTRMSSIGADIAEALVGIQHVSPPSIAPFAVDIDPEDLEPPARNSDALGLRTTRPFDASRTTSRFSFAAGLIAGLLALSVGGTVAYASMTDATGAPGSSTTTFRERHIVVHAPGTLSVDRPEAVDTKAADTKAAPAPKHRAHRTVRRAAGGEATDPTGTTAETPAEAPLVIPTLAPAHLPQPSDLE